MAQGLVLVSGFENHLQGMQKSKDSAAFATLF